MSCMQCVFNPILLICQVKYYNPFPMDFCETLEIKAKYVDKINRFHDATDLAACMWSWLPGFPFE